MIQVKIYDERVTNIYYGETLIEGFIRIESIPSPEEIPGKIPVMYYRNGAIVYEYEEAPEATEDDTGTRIDSSEIYIVGGVGDTSAKRYESRGVRGL